MARIDKATIDKIHDATNIVDVVSDFVSLKKRGSSYLGLCPFHNERTPSFSVSAARGIFKCFSCGKAGNAISFLMDLESMSYVEALKWLGRKYGIEVAERELTSTEKAAEAERESLLAANEFALGVFEANMAETEEGRAVGRAYFAERGISDAMIAKFHLGYALERSDDLLSKARAAGFDDRYLVETGLEVRTERGLYDRFKGRVIYPIHSLSGRVVAFGGRTLRKEKTVAKYVNSPETAIYSKSNELYGMFQARNAIARKKNCILVEGYMDVISMHQAGVENVVASSGTSLTEGQIRMIRRFADSVTLIYDSDPAGIKASLRGINMLVAAGLALRIVLLPEGDDPDSFAQNHSSSEVEQYIEAHSQNLIGFKADILLADAGPDPRKRGEAINDILQTIALIPDLVEQSIYIDELSKKTGVAPNTLANQLKKFVAANAEKAGKKRQQEEAAQTVADIIDVPEAGGGAPSGQGGGQPPEERPEVPQSVAMAEEELMRHVLRQGLMYLCDVVVAPGAEPVPMSVVDYIECELNVDNISFRTPIFSTIWDMALAIRDAEFPAERGRMEADLDRRRAEAQTAGLEAIRNTARDHAEIVKLEKALDERVMRELNEAYDDFTAGFIRDRLLRSERREIIDEVARLTSDTVVLSRMYPKVDPHSLAEMQIPMAMRTLKSALLKEELNAILLELSKEHTPEEIARLLTQFQEKKAQSMRFDKSTGEIVITPPGK